MADKIKIKSDAEEISLGGGLLQFEENASQRKQEKQLARIESVKKAIAASKEKYKNKKINN